MQEEWKEECQTDPSTSLLDVWIKTAICNNNVDAYTPEDRDRMLLSKKPS